VPRFPQRAGSFIGQTIPKGSYWIPGFYTPYKRHNNLILKGFFKDDASESHYEPA
jgi:hypothetical protein